MLSEKARSQQTALWELVETEVAYIRTLKVIQDVSKKDSYRARKMKSLTLSLFYSFFSIVCATYKIT